MNYVQLQQTIQDYSENTEALFVANIPTFVQQAEERIYNSVQFPSLRKNVTGALTPGNQYLSLPNDFLSTYSIAIFSTNYTTLPYTYLLNKDVNFIREAYPSPTVANQGVPKYYALFGPTYNNTNELSLILGPTPDASYIAELHYFFYPPSIVQGIITGIGSLTAGTNYTNGTYENIPVTGGSGQNATATITISGSSVTAFTITNGGQFFVVGDTISFSSTSISTTNGTGSGFSTTVTSINNSTGTSWLGDNFDPVLLYGAMREAMIFMKGEADMVKYYEDKYSEALMLAKRLGDGLERGDAYRDGQTKLNVNIKGSTAV
jgi:hypothetical protein